MLANGYFTVYEAALDLTSRTVDPSRRGFLAVKFFKVFSQTISGESETQALVPFRDLQGYQGLFIPGSAAQICFASDHGPFRIWDLSDKQISSISSTQDRLFYQFDQVRLLLPSCITARILQSKQNLISGELPPLCYDRHMPFVTLTEGRVFTHLDYESTHAVFVGASLYDPPFEVFDEDGLPIWRPDDDDLLQPTSFRSALEIIVPGTWHAADGYEFRSSEVVIDMKVVSVNTRSTLSGRRDYICVGTAVYKGEDQATRGGLYMFEIIDTEEGPKIRKKFSEDVKSSVSNVVDIDGYVVHTVGQKVLCFVPTTYYR